jgi:type II secretory pathway pseudopilin PulG
MTTHSLAPSQRGALFGLDARIALALFGILSIVAGYLAFGRLEVAKQAVLIQEMEAFDHAFRAYQADMGTFYLFTLDKPVNDDSSIEDITALWKPSMVKNGFKPHWNGPYLHRDTRKSRHWGNYSVFYSQADRRNYCTADSECVIWLSLSGVPAELWKAVNHHYDEGSAQNEAEEQGREISTGRVQADDATDVRTLLFRVDGRAPGGATPE